MKTITKIVDGKEITEQVLEENDYLEIIKEKDAKIAEKEKLISTLSVDFEKKNDEYVKLRNKLIEEKYDNKDGENKTEQQKLNDAHNTLINVGKVIEK
ncbi:MAG: hypothetical protein ACRCXT_19000 [Paraclostridium sp.]